MAGRDPAMPIAQAHQRGRAGACHRHRSGEIDAQHRDRVAHRRRHVEMRSGQRAVVAAAGAVLHGDVAALQHELARLRSDRGHRIGHQHEAAGRLAAQRQAERGRVHMMAVDDQPADQRVRIERGADHARLARAERRHGIEQMGDAAHARGHRRLGLVVARIGMPRCDHHAGGDELLDVRSRHAFGRERHQRAAARQAGQRCDPLRVERADLLGRMDALAIDVEERALDMDAEHARYARRDRRVHGRHRAADDVEIVADQRGEEAGGAEAAMRGADRGDALHGRRVVEQHAAAAIDLGIDESGDERAVQPPRLGAGGNRAGRHHAGDARAVDQDGDIFAERAVDQRACRDQRLHQMVSVTLASDGGRSGSKPRAIESALAAR